MRSRRIVVVYIPFVVVTSGCGGITIEVDGM